MPPPGEWPVALIAIIVVALIGLGCCLFFLGPTKEKPLRPDPRPSRSTDGTRSPVAGDHRWALLIGVDGYLYERPLRFCGNDILAMQDGLFHVGFHDKQVLYLYEKAPHGVSALRENILYWLQWLCKDKDENDLVLVAFCGHGICVNQRSYICPRDGRRDDPRTMILIEDIFRTLQASRAGRKVLLVDACCKDAASAERNMGASEQDGDFARCLDDSTRRWGKGIVAITSCSPGQVARETEVMQHGVFTNYFIEGLRVQPTPACQPRRMPTAIFRCTSSTITPAGRPNSTSACRRQAVHLRHLP